MPEKFVYKLIEVSISAGATESFSWTFDNDYIVHHVHMFDQDDAALYECVTTVRIVDKILTKDAVPCVLFTPSDLGAVDWNIRVVKGEKIEGAITNNRTATVTARIVLELEIV